MSTRLQRRCSSCGGCQPHPLFHWLCRPCVRRIEGEPIDLTAYDPDQPHAVRQPEFGAKPEDKRVYRVAPVLRRLINKGG